MSRKRNIYGIPSRPHLEEAESKQLQHGAKTLTAPQRRVVEAAIRQVCLHRKYFLRAINVRTNHVHAIVSAMCRPESILNVFKSYSTRLLRDQGLIESEIRPWSRHGSTVYLWKENDLARGMEYVLLGQDKPFARD